MELLEQTRKINRMMQSGDASDYKAFACLIRDLIESNTYIVDEQGKIKGIALIREFECNIMREVVLDNDQFPQDYMDFVMSIRETKSNIPHKNQKCSFVNDKKCIFKDKMTTVVPIYGSRTRIGTLIIAKYDAGFSDEDLLLAEYAATLIGQQMYHELAIRQIDEERDRIMIEKTMNKTLSYHERLAILHIIGTMETKEEFIVASKVADEVGITRSVIVNALRKFESAGFIGTRSCGMKGTYINIINDFVHNYVKERYKAELGSNLQ